MISAFTVASGKNIIEVVAAEAAKKGEGEKGKERGVAGDGRAGWKKKF